MKKKIDTLIITLSDRASNGTYKDRSGPLISDSLKSHEKLSDMAFIVDSKIIPDEKENLQNIINSAVKNNTKLIITTGGTGIGPRDITYEAVSELLDKNLPGIMDFIRLKYGAKFPSALLSRSVAGVIKDTLIFAIPGSPKAAHEYMSEIIKLLDHALYTIQGIDIHKG